MAHKRVLKTIKEEVRIELTREDVFRVLSMHYDMPEGCSMHVEVPGGADWSNCNLELDKDTPLVVTYTRIKHSTK